MFIDYETSDGKVHTGELSEDTPIKLPKGTKVIKIYDKKEFVDDVPSWYLPQLPYLLRYLPPLDLDEEK